MLEIGINENLRLSEESKINEKGSLELYFVEGDNVAKTALDMLATEEADAESSKMLIFPPNVKEYNSEDLRSSTDIVKDLKATYKCLYHIFNLYFTKDELAKIYPISCLTEGLSITPENQETMLQQESVVVKMSTNLAHAIVKVIKENNLGSKEAFRLKLLRQSPKKAFPRFTYKPDFGDWVELMSVPKEQSKVAFTAWEKSKG